MKKILLTIAGLCIAGTVLALPKSLYVKKGEGYSRYNFGVAGMMEFSNNGKILSITGYNEAIDLDNVDYISFDAPVSDQALTPSAQKEKLLEIGEEVNKRVNMKENEDVINMFHLFLDHIEVNGSTVCPPSEFDVPEEYVDVHARRMMRALSMILHLNPAGGPALGRSSADLYKIEDYLGVYTADYGRQTWEKTSDADYLEMRFMPPTGENVIWSVRVTPSDDYTQWNNPEADVRLPKTMDIVLRKDREELGKLRLSSELRQDRQISLAIKGNVGTAGIDFTFDVLNSGIDVRSLITNKGEYFAQLSQHVAGKNLLDYDVMRDDFEAIHYHDEEDNCIEEPERIIAHFIRGNFAVDILHLLQVEGKLANPSRIYEIAVEEDDDEDDAWIEYKGYGIDSYGPASLLSEDKTTLKDRWNTEPEEVMPWLNALNDYSDISFYYDGDRTLQGFLGLELDVEKEEWPDSGEFVIIKGHLVWVYESDGDYWVWAYDESGNWTKLPIEEFDLTEKDIVRPVLRTSQYCDIEPLLFFPDGTSFYIEDYFDEISFKKLINDYNDVIDTYSEITGQR